MIFKSHDLKFPQRINICCLRWYELDSNAVPDVFLLNPISRNIPDFLSKDFETQKKAKSEWWTESERLMEIIATGATEGLDKDSARKYKISGRTRASSTL